MNKRKLILFLLLFLLFILEGTLVPLLIPAAWQTRITPHLVFVVILYFSVYENRHTGLILGLVFGALHDIVFYGALIGAYSFAMGLSGYLPGLLSRNQRAPLPLMMIVVLLGGLLLDSILFGTYTLFELIHQSYAWALKNHIISNVLVQFVFALAIYVPLRRQLDIITRRRSSEENT